MEEDKSILPKGMLKTVFWVAAFDLVLYAALHFTTGGATLGLHVAQFLDPLFQLIGLSSAAASTAPAVGSVIGAGTAAAVAGKAAFTKVAAGKAATVAAAPAAAAPTVAPVLGDFAFAN